MDKDINRIKVVLAEKKRTNKWLAEQLGCAPILDHLVGQRVAFINDKTFTHDCHCKISFL